MSQAHIWFKIDKYLVKVMRYWERIIWTVSLIVHIVECGRQASWVRGDAKKTSKRSTNKFPLNKLLSFQTKVLSITKEN